MTTIGVTVNELLNRYPLLKLKEAKIYREIEKFLIEESDDGKKQG